MYSVKYKSQKDWFWKTIKNIKMDGFLTEINLKVRFFITSNEERIEIPCENYIFKFSKERFDLIQKNLENNKG